MLTNGQYYHVVSRSIAGYKVFNTNEDFKRIVNALIFYLINPEMSYSYLLKQTDRYIFNALNNFLDDKANHIVSIIAYCIMPTHIHLLLRQNQDDGISSYISNLLNSYTKFFNAKHKRKGPLWEGRFKSSLVDNDDILLHITRYIHLNPTSAGIVLKPEDWSFSSYNEYISNNINRRLCDYKNVIDIEPKKYKKFVNDRKNYQKELAIIKANLIDYYSG